MKLHTFILGGALLLGANQAMAVDVSPTCVSEQQVVDQQAAICDPVPPVCPDTAACSPVVTPIAELAACENLKSALNAYKGCIKQRIDAFKDAAAALN